MIWFHANLVCNISHCATWIIFCILFHSDTMSVDKSRVTSCLQVSPNNSTELEARMKHSSRTAISIFLNCASSLSMSFINRSTFERELFMDGVNKSLAFDILFSFIATMAVFKLLILYSFNNCVSCSVWRGENSTYTSFVASQ